MHALRLIVICIVCAAVGFACSYWWPQGEPPLRERRLIEASASSIDRIELPGGSAERTGPDQWLVTRNLEGGPPLTWPGDQVRLRALTRLIASATAITGSDSDAVPSGGPRVTIFERGGSATELVFAGSPVGGKVTVQVSAPNAEPWIGLADAEVMDLFAGGVNAWLTVSAMPGVPLDPARLELTGSGGGVVLDRLGSRWVMREPVAAECEANLVALAARQLAALSGEQMVENSDNFTIEPSAMWSVVDSRRSGRTWRVELFDTPGEPLAAARCSVLGPEGDTAWGPVFMSIDRSESDRIDPTASAYLSRRTLRASSADLTSMTVAGGESRVELARDLATIATWHDADGNEQGGAASLTSLLTNAQALAAVPTEGFEPGFAPQFAVELEGGHSIRVGLYEASGQSRVATDSEGVLRVYDHTDARPVWQWLNSLFETTGP